MKQLQDTLIQQTNKMQQQTMKEVLDIKQKLESENHRRDAAEQELNSLREQVREEQRRRKVAEKRAKRTTEAMLTDRNHLHNSALSMLTKTPTVRKQYGTW